MMKRAVDFSFAIVGLVMLAPLLVVIGGVVKIDSKGPMLFKQVRVGRGGAPFALLKFRTMTIQSHDPGPSYTATGDRRVTRIGRVLRKYKIDELPQLINVLRGEMSMVGPRPEVPEYIAKYPASSRRKVLSVRPGITDDASIHFRNEGDLLAKASDPGQYYVDELLPIKIKIYENYVDNHSMTGDLRIILRTLWSVVSR